MYSRVGCHLCEEAERIVRAVAVPPHVIDVVDIDTDTELIDAYTVRVPVVAVDGVEIAQFVLDEHTLRRALPGS